MSISAKNVVKVIGEPPVKIIKNISLNINDGEFVSLTGRSGSGKSTLLYLLSSLDTLTSGSVSIDGKEFSRMPQPELHRFRNENMGFIFQFHYLIAELTAVENVAFPARRTGQYSARLAKAYKLLDDFGLAGKHDRLPRQLSGGEQQRVAAARALVMDPRYLFADEPTGALDSINSKNLMQILFETNRKNATTIVLVTHDTDFAAMAQRTLHLVDGEMV